MSEERDVRADARWAGIFEFVDEQLARMDFGAMEADKQTDLHIERGITPYILAGLSRRDAMVRFIARAVWEVMRERPK